MIGGIREESPEGLQVYYEDFQPDQLTGLGKEHLIGEWQGTQLRLPHYDEG
jgi:hypothetical protein